MGNMKRHFRLVCAPSWLWRSILTSICAYRKETSPGERRNLTESVSGTERGREARKAKPGKRERC